MIDTYFDTNVYGHIFRRQHRITDAAVEKLEGAIQDGKLRIFTSFPVIEETNIARLSSLDDANGRLELIRTLAVQDPIIKHHSFLMEDDIRAFANGEKPSSRFEPAYPRFRDIFWDHTAKFYRQLDEYAKDSLDRIREFSDDMNTKFNKIRPTAEALSKTKQRQPFLDYWNEMSLPWVEQLVGKYGMLAECKNKGSKELLNIQSVRLNTIAQLSLNYANAYDRKTFDTGNSRDMHHVVCASAVPIFVTHDKRLRALFERMPTPGLEVIDIHELLKRV